MENTHKTIRVQGEELFTLLLSTTLCLVSLTLEFGFILFFQFFRFVLWCFKFLLIEGTHKAMGVQREEQFTFLLLVALCLGSPTLEFGSISFFEFFCFAPCLNHLSWFKILGKLIHDSTLWKVDNFLVYCLVFVFHGVMVCYLGFSLEFRMLRFLFMFSARYITFDIQS